MCPALNTGQHFWPEAVQALIQRLNEAREIQRQWQDEPDFAATMQGLQPTQARSSAG